jgi:hypothetical protein
MVEGGLDLDELDVEPPQLGRVIAGEIGAQQIATFAPADLAQPGAIEREAEGSALLRHHNIDQTPTRVLSTKFQNQRASWESWASRPLVSMRRSYSG